MSADYRDKRICVVGTGYVGMATAVGLTELNHRVRGYDIDCNRVRGLQVGTTPYREPGIESALRANLTAGRLTFHENLVDAVEGADFIIVCVSTPAEANGAFDLTHLYSAINTLSRVAPRQSVVVLRSTIPPGTTNLISTILKPICVIYAPEFLREGSALNDFLNPARIVVGCLNHEDASAYLDLFSSLERPTIVTHTRDAELIKGCSNAFLALKVTFANQIANLCDSVEADALEVLRGVGADPRIGHLFLEPGIGFGGPCFEKDVKSLHHISSMNGCGGELFTATLEVNAQQPNRLIALLENELGDLAGRKVGVWGLAFKAGTDDTRDSMAIRIVNELLARGADIIAYDPEVPVTAINARCANAMSALEAAEADALMILTEWPEFRDIPLDAIANRLQSKLIIDGRNLLEPAACAAAGIRYLGIGRKKFATSARLDSPVTQAA